MKGLGWRLAVGRSLEREKIQKAGPVARLITPAMLHKDQGYIQMALVKVMIACTTGLTLDRMLYNPSRRLTYWRLTFAKPNVANFGSSYQA